MDLYGCIFSLEIFLLFLENTVVLIDTVFKIFKSLFIYFLCMHMYGDISVLGDIGQRTICGIRFSSS